MAAGAALPHTAAADPGFAKGRGHGERAEREPKWGSGGKAPSGVQGHSPMVGVIIMVRSPLKLNAFFVYFYTKSGQKLRTEMKTCPVTDGDCFAQPRPALRFGQWGRRH